MRIRIRLKRQQNRYRALRWGSKRSISIAAEITFYTIIILLSSVISYNLKVLVDTNSMISEVVDKKLESYEISNKRLMKKAGEIYTEVIAATDGIDKEKLDAVYIESDKEVFWFTVMLRSGKKYPLLSYFGEEELLKLINMACRSEKFLGDYDKCIGKFLRAE